MFEWVFLAIFSVIVLTSFLYHEYAACAYAWHVRKLDRIMRRVGVAAQHINKQFIPLKDGVMSTDTKWTATLAIAVVLLDVERKNGKESAEARSWQSLRDEYIGVMRWLGVWWCGDWDAALGEARALLPPISNRPVCVACPAAAEVAGG
jgi:predicted membrane channel-forming protein YqfA (hemolysin III family)